MEAILALQVGLEDGLVLHRRWKDLVGVQVIRIDDLQVLRVPNADGSIGEEQIP